MDVAREAARRGWPPQSVFVCDVQTAGRGRQGRRWESPPGQGLLFTLLLHSLPQPLHSTMLASVALCEAIERLYQLEPAIKWPNDILLDQQKLAGVLAEASSGPPGDYTLVGCGVNANQDPGQLAALGRAATSLREAAGHVVHRGELLAVCLEQIADWLTRYRADEGRALRQAWTNRLSGIGQSIRLRDQDEELTAVVEGVAPDGALIVRPPSAPPRRIIAGEILL
jgi:BirA family biotin operon repressor/biotin-[acetyl-CoA-carboxylase] ligase